MIDLYRLKDLEVPKPKQQQRKRCKGLSLQPDSAPKSSFLDFPRSNARNCSSTKNKCRKPGHNNQQSKQSFFSQAPNIQDQKMPEEEKAELISQLRFKVDLTDEKALVSYLLNYSRNQ